MQSSDFYCLAQVAYESSDGSDDDGDQGLESTSELENVRRTEADTVDLFTVGSALKETGKNESLRWFSSKFSQEKSTDYDSSNRTPRLKKSFPNRPEYLDMTHKMGRFEDEREIPTRSARAEQLSAATLNSKLVSSVIKSNKDLRASREHSKSHQTTKPTEIYRPSSLSKKRKISTFTTLFDKESNRTPNLQGVAKVEEKNILHEIQFGPSFIQKKEKKDDLLEDESSLMLHENTNDHSPLATSRSISNNRSTRYRGGPFTAMMNNIRRQKEESWVRLSSGSYPLNKNDVYDPRNRSSFYIDLTVIDEEHMTGALGGKHSVYNCYIHSIVHQLVDPNISSGIVPRSRYKSRMSLLFDLEQSNERGLTPLPMLDENLVSSSKMFCFLDEVLKRFIISKGGTLRVYDPTLLLVKLKVPWETDGHDAKDWNSDQSMYSMLFLCSRLCEPCPDSHHLPTSE